MPTLRSSLSPLVVILVLAACGGGSAFPAAQGPEPQLVVERFLQAVNVNDWDVMARLFGTRDQTIRERDGELRADRHMQILASLLRHEDFVVQSRGQVPGREDATSIVVEIVRNGQRTAIPFVVVRKNDGGWIIQEIRQLEDLV